jgi:aldose 1-epimerase
MVEVGGGLREYTVGGEAVLDGYANHEMASGGRGQHLLPWPNRLEDGRYEFGGRWHQLPLDELETGTAIHGLARWANWVVQQETEHRARAAYVLHPRPGYPFCLAIEVVYTLGEDGLTVRTEARNVGTEALPFGLGHHPYLTVGPRVDEGFLTVPARGVLDVDARNLPTRLRGVAPFRERIGARQIDSCFTDLERDEDGRAVVELRADARSVRVWMDATYAYVQVFTGDTLPPEQRRRGLAVEPMTCPPNALRSGVGLRVLRPGETCIGTWGIASARC